MEPKGYRRRRPALSCVECRRRKIKCDRNDPCSHCVLTKGRCVYKIYSSHQQSALDSPSNVTSGTPVGEILSSTTDGRSASDNTPAGRMDISTAAVPLSVVNGYQGTPNSADHCNRDGTLDRSLCPASDVPDFQQSLQLPGMPLLSVENDAPSQVTKDKFVLLAQLQDAQISLDKSRILRWRHWGGTENEFSTIINCMTKYCGSETTWPLSVEGPLPIVTEIRDLATKCKSLARTIKLNRPSRFLVNSGLKLTPPNRELADRLVDSYLEAFESAYRVLHVPTFKTEYRRYWAGPEYAPINLSLKVLLVIAIGSSLNQLEDEETGFTNMVHQWVYAAESWLSGPLEKDRLDIHGIQIHCLTILARQMLSIGGDLLWASIGSLIHKAMQIGLHRDPEHLPRLSVLQTEVRRRLWTTILEMVVQSSLDSSMPPRISVKEYDTKPPNNVNDEDINDSTTTLEPSPPGMYTSTSMQLIISNSLPLRLQIVQLLNGLNSELSYPDVLTLSAEITNACRKCSNFMQNGGKSNMTPFHRNLLDYMLRRFLLPLHSPFASEARKNPLFSYSLKVGLDTAMSIMSPEPDENYSKLRAAGGGMFKEGFRSAMTTIGRELLTQVESQRLDGTLYRISPYRQLLKQAICDLIELSIQRMKHGETNVKSHMFLSMILAQVEAIEKDVQCETKIVEKMKESLAVGHGILCGRVESISVLGADDEGLSTFFNDNEDYGMNLDMDFLLPDIS